MATANERVVNGVKTRLLHNKDYVEVAERTRILHELRKSGEIKEFEMVESEPREIVGRAYWRISARIDGKLYIGDAEIKFDAPKNTPDGTNPFECAETSAFGRMLAFAGLGTVESLASYDEVACSQPFVAVVEQANSRGIVEAAPAHRQIQPPAQPQEVETATAIRAKIDGLIGEFATLFPNMAKKPNWQTLLAQRVWGEVPGTYTLDHYRTLNAYYLQQKSAGKSARVHAM